MAHDEAVKSTTQRGELQKPQGSDASNQRRDVYVLTTVSEDYGFDFWGVYDSLEAAQAASELVKPKDWEEVAFCEDEDTGENEPVEWQSLGDEEEWFTIQKEPVQNLQDVFDIESEDLVFTTDSAEA